MREIIVSNSTNVFTVTVIVLLLTVVTFGVLEHFRYVIFDTTSELRLNAIKSLAVQTVAETILQVYIFFTNLALR